jgi:hypothetical protein
MIVGGMVDVSFPTVRNENTVMRMKCQFKKKSSQYRVMALSSKLIPRKFCPTTLRVEGEDGTETGIGDAAETARGRRKVKRATKSISMEWERR